MMTILLIKICQQRHNPLILKTLSERSSSAVLHFWSGQRQSQKVMEGGWAICICRIFEFQTEKATQIPKSHLGNSAYVSESFPGEMTGRVTLLLEFPLKAIVHASTHSNLLPSWSQVNFTIEK